MALVNVAFNRFCRVVMVQLPRNAPKVDSCMYTQAGSLPEKVKHVSGTCRASLVTINFCGFLGLAFPRGNNMLPPIPRVPSPLPVTMGPVRGQLMLQPQAKVLRHIPRSLEPRAVGVCGETRRHSWRC